MVFTFFMVKKVGCDLCNKDFNEGTGGELKFKGAFNGLWKIADVCGTCVDSHLGKLLITLKWKRYNKDTKRFVEADSPQ